MNIQDFKESLNNATFYDAIRLDNNGDAYIDMDIARIMWMDNLRRIRNIKIKPLDIESLRAIENNDFEGMQAVIAKKKILRDMPETYDLSQVQTWQELLTMWPDCLK